MNKIIRMLFLSALGLGFSSTALATPNTEPTYTPPETIHCKLVPQSPILSRVECTGNNLDKRFVMVSGFQWSDREQEVDLQFTSAAVKKDPATGKLSSRASFFYQANLDTEGYYSVELNSTYKWITPDYSNPNWVKGLQNPYQCKGKCPLTNLPFDNQETR